MSLISKARWDNRTWRTDMIDVVSGLGMPGAEGVAWGLPIRTRFAGAWLRTRKALDNGRRFDLSADSVLEWTHVAATEVMGLHLDGWGYLKERIVLDRIPPRQVWEFLVDVPPGSTVHYQPPLTAQEIERGDVRPPAVVGSYALYAPSGEKLGHWLRPFALDARGERVWLHLAAEMIAPGLVRLTVSAQRPTLERLKYPVVIDPTFGYTSIGGGNGWTHAVPFVRATGRFAPAESGTVSGIAWYGYANSAATRLTFGLFADSAGAPAARCVDTAELAPPTNPARWHSAEADFPYAVDPAALYHIAMHGGGGDFRHYWDVVSGRSVHYVNWNPPYVAGACWTDPASGHTRVNNFAYSAYATYTPGAPGRLPWQLFFGRGV